jgi:hypothetical protein
MAPRFAAQPQSSCRCNFTPGASLQWRRQPRALAVFDTVDSVIARPPLLASAFVRLLRCVETMKDVIFRARAATEHTFFCVTTQ